MYEEDGACATHCTAVSHTATYCNTLPCTAEHCNTLQHTAYILNMSYCWRRCGCMMRIEYVRRTATHWKTLQHIAEDGMRAEYVRIVGGAADVWGGWSVCNTLQHTATHCTGCVSVYACRCTRVQFNRSNSQVALSPMSVDQIILSHERVFLIIHVTVDT